MTVTFDPIRVLYVGSTESADRIAAALERADSRLAVRTRTDANGVLDRLDGEVAPDCVVSEYALSDRTGIELLDAVRETDPHLPFVLLIADGSEAVASEAISAGVSDYLRWEDDPEQYATLADRIMAAVAEYRSRAELEASRERLSTFVEQSPLGVIEFDPEFRIVSVNDAAEAILGYAEPDLIGETWERIVTDASYDDVEEVVSMLTDAEGGHHSIDENVRKDGERIVCEWYNHVITDDDGDVTAVFSQFQDVTDRRDRRRRIEALHEATRKLMGASTRRAVAEHAVETARDVLGLPINSVYLYDEEADVLSPAAITEEALDVIGDPPAYEPGESLSWDAFQSNEVQVFEDVSTHPGRYNDDTAFRAEIILPLGDHGVMFVASTETAAFDDADVTLARTLAANTEEALSRIDRERELRESRRRHRAVVDNFPDGAVFLFDEDLRYVLGGGSELAAVGLSADDVEGATVHEVFPDRVADELAGHYREALAGTERTFELEYRGEQYQTQTLPVRDDNDEIASGIAVSQRITERKRRERELARQNERLDEFASVVSHDLRNPLNVAQGRLDLARQECDSDHLDDVAGAHDRMHALIEDLLVLARQGESATEPEPIALDSLVRECWANVETESASLVSDADLTIRADRGQLQQLVENLFRNAIEHGSTGNQNSASSGDAADHADPEVAIRVDSLDDGFYVADDGPGIPESNRDEVFEAGYSTSDSGTGFGLSIVERIAESHDWTVGVTESETGGARFEIRGVEVGG